MDHQTFLVDKMLTHTPGFLTFKQNTPSSDYVTHHAWRFISGQANSNENFEHKWRVWTLQFVTINIHRLDLAKMISLYYYIEFSGTQRRVVKCVHGHLSSYITGHLFIYQLCILNLKFTLKLCTSDLGIYLYIPDQNLLNVRLHLLKLFQIFCK